MEDLENIVRDFNVVAYATLHIFQLCNFIIFNGGGGLEFRIKPCSTICFSRFIREDYNDDC